MCRNKTVYCFTSNRFTNGALEDWLEYRATFENLIHSNDSLNDLQKFHYLKASLGGIAAQLVKPTPFIAENYSIAWSALCDEYDNSKVLIHEHVRSLFQLSSIRREHAAELKTLVNQVSQHLTCLEMLGESRQNLGNLLLTHLIKMKLDNSTAQEWEKYVNKKQRKSQEVLGARVNSSEQKGSLSWEDMKEFLKERASLLRTTEVDCKTDSKKIKSYTPSFPIRITDLKIPDEIVLADPEFHIPGPVQVLIGGELFWDLIRDGKIALGLNKPILTETALEWIVAGQVECRQPRKVKRMCA
nr:unnamed protein product [Callosobruchus analis]